MAYDLEGIEDELNLAVIRGDAAAVKRFHHIGSDLDQKVELDLTPLHVAAISGHPEMILLLLQLGSQSLDALTKYRHAPLHVAAIHGHARCVEVLMLSGSQALNWLDENGESIVHLVSNLSTLKAVLRFQPQNLSIMNNLNESPIFARCDFMNMPGSRTKGNCPTPTRFWI